MSTLFLVLAALGLAGVLNALRPLRAMPVLLPAFFWAWLTAELAPQLVVLTVLEAVVFALLGAVEGARGWLALALAALTVLGLLRLIRSSENAAHVADKALTGAALELRTALQRAIQPAGYGFAAVQPCFAIT